MDCFAKPARNDEYGNAKLIKHCTSILTTQAAFFLKKPDPQTQSLSTSTQFSTPSPKPVCPERYHKVAFSKANSVWSAECEVEFFESKKQVAIETIIAHTYKKLKNITKIMLKKFVKRKKEYRLEEYRLKHEAARKVINLSNLIAGSIAHELRLPLAGIKINMENLRDMDFDKMSPQVRNKSLKEINDFTKCYPAFCPLGFSQKTLN